MDKNELKKAEAWLKEKGWTKHKGVKLDTEEINPEKTHLFFEGMNDLKESLNIVDCTYWYDGDEYASDEIENCLRFAGYEEE